MDSLSQQLEVIRAHAILACGRIDRLINYFERCQKTPDGYRVSNQPTKTDTDVAISS